MSASAKRTQLQHCATLGPDQPTADGPTRGKGGGAAPSSPFQSPPAMGSKEQFSQVQSISTFIGQQYTKGLP